MPARMPAPSHQRVAVPAALLAMLCGALAGLGTFAAAATLWRAGHQTMAAIAAETTLFLALACLAAFLLLARPDGQRRARVPVGRPVPRAWWPREPDPVPVLVVSAGTPLLAAATAAVLLFR
ncbi:MAG TPA: hypothetical protein VE219_02400 [Candidatus Sulfotelmatobacter sp.]|nr:hypothetical protein [Candidatus Sulfotelmatobacter sp.]